MRMLHRPRVGDDGSKLIVLTLKRHLATCAYALDNLDSLICDPTARGIGACIQGGKLLRQPAHTSPQQRPSA